jgi:hypothetical protein
MRASTSSGSTGTARSSSTGTSCKLSLKRRQTTTECSDPCPIPPSWSVSATGRANPAEVGVRRPGRPCGLVSTDGGTIVDVAGRLADVRSSSRRVVCRRTNPHRDTLAPDAGRRSVPLGDSRKTRPVKCPMSGCQLGHSRGERTGDRLRRVSPTSKTSPRNATRWPRSASRRSGSTSTTGSPEPTGPARAAQAMAACRAGDVLVVTKLDRLARSLPDARIVAEPPPARSSSASAGDATRRPGRQAAAQRVGDGGRYLQLLGCRALT